MDNWERFERERKRKAKGRLTPGSGNKGLKGDVHTELFIEEDKSSQMSGPRGHYIDLQVEWFSKVTKYADSYMRGEKKPLVSVSIANEVVYCFLQYDYWLECKGALAVDITRVDCTGKRQVRMYACDDHAYTVYTFDDTGDWICIPEADHMLLIKIERESSGETKQCKKTAWKPVKRGPRPKTQQQLEWEAAQKKKSKERAKELALQWKLKQKQLKNQDKK